MNGTASILNAFPCVLTRFNSDAPYTAPEHGNAARAICEHLIGGESA